MAYWDRDEEATAETKLLDVVHADAYASTLQEAVRICEDAATGTRPRAPHEAARTKAETERRSISTSD